MYSDEDDPRSFGEASLKKIYKEYLELGSIRAYVKKHGVTYHHARTRIMVAHELFKDDSEFDSLQKRFRKKPTSRPLSSKSSERIAPQNASSEVIDETHEGARSITGKGIRTLDDLLNAAGVNRDEWLVTKYIVNKWDAVAKDGTTELFQVKAWLERRPEFFHTKVAPVAVIPRTYTKRSTPDQVALIIPDSQHGFRRHNGKLIPMHDRRCVDLAIQVCDFIQPDEVVLLGDMLDLAPWSTKYSTPPDLKYTTQPSLIELHWFLQSLRRTGDHKMTYLEGNHEIRIKKAITDKLEEAVDLRPVGQESDHALLSIPNLLSLDEIGVDYVEPYGSAYWLFDNLVRCHHGSTVRTKGGQTVTAMLNSGTTSHEIVGHIHRREFASRRIPAEGGFKTVNAMSPGCFCRIDTEISIVPAFAGKPVDWQHGMGIVYKYGDKVSMHLIPIDDGVCYVDGERFEGSDLQNEMDKLLQGQ
tara:strand:- start:849 stop:2261 length:1413 start_codon:yes stop_codon:yes gene_type:complete